MPFTEAARIALASLRANKLRSFLTVLGILIGVSSVIAVVAITEGLDRYIADKVLQLGSRAFAVQKMPDIITSREQFVEMMRRRDITMADLAAVRAGCQSCSEVGGSILTGRDVKYGRVTQTSVQVIGITANVQRIGAIRDLTAGRPLVDAFFPGGMEPLGKELRLGNQPVRIVGVAEKMGSVFGESQDNFMWIPITYFRKVYGARSSVTIQAQAGSMALFERAQDEARVIMRARRHLGFEKPDDFSVETGESVMDLWQTATRGIYVVTVVVTGISLVVGGVVVMNIMLVSVTERIREIGVRKALGARRRDIQRQFLVESVILSVFGGLLGLMGAALFSWGLAAVLGSIMATTFTAPIRLWAVLLALLVSTVVGLVAGVYPARRAAALDPVAALRSE